jgi:hypothetical protein
MGADARRLAGDGNEQAPLDVRGVDSRFEV